MSHGFSRFGPPSARERFHTQARRGGSLAMFLPTILATLFLFTAVIALNKVASMSNKDALRLIPVEDVFPTPADVEENSQKEYWEAPPPPSPDEVVAAQQRREPLLPEEQVRPIGLDEKAAPPSKVEIRARPLPSLKTEIKMPEVQPDTSLPEAVKP